jgi:hypothetical protein
VTVRMRGHELIQRKKGKMSGGTVWEIRQVTPRMSGQDGLTEGE